MILAKIGKITRLLAVISLVLAYCTGFLLKGKGEADSLRHHFSELQFKDVYSAGETYVVKPAGKDVPAGYIHISSANGWGGPLKTAVWIDEKQMIKKIAVLSHKETPSFFDHINRVGFFNQFAGKKILDPLHLENGVDGVSGATISSLGFTKSIRQSASQVAKERFRLSVPVERVEFKFGKNEMLLLIFYTVVLISVLKKYKKVRYLSLATGIVFLGIIANRPITLSNFSSLLLGYIPDIHTQLFFWLLVIGTIAITLLYGRNIYCSWMCPFGGVQEFISLAGGFRVKTSTRVNQVMKKGVYVLFWLALMITFITSNPALGTYEPFAVLFSLKGMAIQWYLVSIAIIGSFVIPRFWCRFFCPVGVCLKYTASFGRNLKQVLVKERIKQWKEKRNTCPTS